MRLADGGIARGDRSHDRPETRSSRRRRRSHRRVRGAASARRGLRGRARDRRRPRACDCSSSTPWDALVLDLMLPGIDGLEICRRARSMERYTPIIITSARGSEVQRVLGLEIGADDYLAKPFSVLELVARVQALLRRVDALARAPAAAASFACGDLTIFAARARGEARRRARGAHAARVRLAVFLCQQPRQGVLAQRAARPRLGTPAQRLRAHRQHAHQPHPREDRGRPRKPAPHPYGLGPRLQTVVRGGRSRDAAHAVRATVAGVLRVAAREQRRGGLADRSARTGCSSRSSCSACRAMSPSTSRPARSSWTRTGLRPDAVRILFDQLMSVNPSVEVYLLDGAGAIVGDAAPSGHLRRDARRRRADRAPARRRAAADPRRRSAQRRTAARSSTPRGSSSTAGRGGMST